MAHNLQLALAESCTGGTVASRLTALPDCSLYFEGGVVSYSNRVKGKILGVKGTTLATHGAVSEEVAKEMAEGALSRFEVDFALSTTGIAGPTGATPQKPVGMVCFAVASRGEPTLSWTAHFQGDRASIIEQATLAALEYLWQSVV